MSNGSKKIAWILVSPSSTTPVSGWGFGGIEPRGLLSMHKKAPVLSPTCQSLLEGFLSPLVPDRGSWGWALPSRAG